MPRIALALALACMTFAAHAESQVPGERFSIDPAQLPRPFATTSAHNSPTVVGRPDNMALNLPPGFTASLMSDQLPKARKLLVAENGDILVARSEDGVISVVRENGPGQPATVSEFANSFDRPYGLAFHDGALYVADGRGVYRLPYKPGDLKVTDAGVRITPEGAFGETGGPGGHWTRNIVFAPDGQHFFVSIGSRENIAEDPLPRASVQEFNSDGSGQRTFATGTRNPIGLAWYPGTADLYTVVNERDGLGDGLVPDYFTRLQDGGFYGWPYAYTGRNRQPGELGDKRPDLVGRSIVPDVLFQSHSAPLDVVFYTGKTFPQEYRGRAFVTMHGSWNDHEPTGYKVVSIPFEDGRPKDEYCNFATGFRLGDVGQRARVWGRPVALAVDRDGSLLISEDAGGTLWRVTYSGGLPFATEPSQIRKEQ